MNKELECQTKKTFEKIVFEKNNTVNKYIVMYTCKMYIFQFSLHIAVLIKFSLYIICNHLVLLPL